MKFALFLALHLGSQSCKTTHFPSAETQTQVIEHSDAIKLKFDHEAFQVLQDFQFNLNQLVVQTFAPKFKKVLSSKFNDTEANRKSLTDLPFYGRLKQFYPESLLKKIRYVVVDQFPKNGELLSAAGINRTQLRQFGVAIDDDVWNFQAAAMTVGTTIYIDKQSTQSISTFFHECVHAVQYDILGETEFLTRYANAFLTGTHYEEIPFEKIAYFLEGFFDKLDKSKSFDAYEYVRKTLQK